MPKLTVIYGENIQTIDVSAGAVLGEVIPSTGLPLEQPCAGRGTCGKCKLIVEAGVAAPDQIELEQLTAGELALNRRLACRARVQGDASVVLTPVVVYSNKNYRASNRYKYSSGSLGLAIDLGTTTVAAFLTTLDDGQVCAGAAALNQQTVYGADVIARLAAARNSSEHRERLHRLALASINQAVDALKLSQRVRQRVTRVTVVGNVAMHHLLARLPVDSLAVAPFQPSERGAIQDATALMEGIFPAEVSVCLPPLVGGFVGSDALACLAYFGFDQPPGPMAAIDLGTNGEVLVTDGHQILTASTAAGPAFEGVNISCGTRAIDGAITAVQLDHADFTWVTIGEEPPVGLTGSGLLSLVYALRRAGIVEPSGRFASSPPILPERMAENAHGARILKLTHDGRLSLSQWDIRELQKAKGAIRAAVDILMTQLGLVPGDLQRLILTGSFGGQVEIEAVIGLGLIPQVPRERVETVPNGAGLGAAMFLSEAGFALGETLAARAEQIDLDNQADFVSRYINAMRLAAD